MRGYTVDQVPESQTYLWEEATQLVGRLPEDMTLRCHELARAIGRVLELPVQDGQYGPVEHSWLWLEEAPFPEHREQQRCWPNILDVYVPGSLPMVQLVYTGIGRRLPQVEAYSMGEARTDIDTECIRKLLAFLRS